MGKMGEMGGGGDCVPRSTEAKKNSGRRWHPSRLLVHRWCGLGVLKGGGGLAQGPCAALLRVCVADCSATLILLPTAA